MNADRTTDTGAPAEHRQTSRQSATDDAATSGLQQGFAPLDALLRTRPYLQPDALVVQAAGDGCWFITNRAGTAPLGAPSFVVLDSGDVEPVAPFETVRDAFERAQHRRHARVPPR